MNPLSPDFQIVSYAHCFPMQDVWILGKLTRSLAEIRRARSAVLRDVSVTRRTTSTRILVICMNKVNFTKRLLYD